MLLFGLALLFGLLELSGVVEGEEVDGEADWSLFEVVPVVELVLLCELTDPFGLVALLLEDEFGLALLSGDVVLGVVADGAVEEAPFWSVEDWPLFIEPVAELWPVVPVELVVPT